MYWQGKCETYSKAELLVPKKFWEVPQSFSSGKLFLVHQNSLNGEGIENIDPSPSNVNKSLRLVGQDDVIVGEMYEMLVSSFKTVVLHISTKLIQVEEFEKDKADPTKQTHQIDYDMAYQCMYQDELSGALWSQESINLFTCVLTYNRPMTTVVICTSLRTNFLTGLS